MSAVLQATGESPPRLWRDPQYVIPLLGMILGNTLNGITLGLSGVLEGFQTRLDQVETTLALGGTRWEAAREVVQDAIRTGLIPIINSRWSIVAVFPTPVIGLLQSSKKLWSTNQIF